MDEVVQTETVTVLGVELITVRDPKVLRAHGWEPPLPSYVTAAPSLWKLWRELAARGK